MPSFHAESGNWTSFIQDFEDMVIEMNWEGIERSKLKVCLEGKAKQVYQSFDDSTKIVMLLLGISLLHFMVTLMKRVLLLLNYFISNNVLTKIRILLCQISLYLPIKLFLQIRTLHRSKLKKLSLRVVFTNLKLILPLSWVNVPLWRRPWVKWKGWLKQHQIRKL